MRKERRSLFSQDCNSTKLIEVLLASYHLVPIYRLSALFSCIIFISIHASGQFPTIEGDAIDSSRIDTTAFVEPDTLIISEYRGLNFDTSYAIDSRELDRAMRNVDFSRHGVFDRGHLGNVGSPQYQMRYNPTTDFGFRLGSEGIDMLFFKPEDIKFYEQNQAYSNFRYTQSSNQSAGSRQNMTLLADISRDVLPDLNFSMDYQRVNHSGSYLNQRTKLGFLNTGLLYKPEKGKFLSALVFTSNTYQSENNGGIVTDTLFEDRLYSLRSNIPITLNQAGLRIAEQRVLWRNQLNFQNKQGEYFRLSLEQHFQNRRNLFSDIDLDDLDLEYYDYLAIDSRGVRHHARNRMWRNRFGFSTLLGKRGLKSRLNAYGEWGIRRLVQDELLENAQSFGFGGDWDTRLKDKLSLAVHGAASVGDEKTKGYDLHAQLTGKLLSQVQFYSVLSSAQYYPGLIFDRVILNGVNVLDQDVSNVQVDQINFGLRLWEDRLDISYSVSRTDNYSYLNENFIPTQHDQSLLSQRLQIEFDLRWKKLVLEGAAFIQTLEAPMNRRPSTYVKAQLYFDDDWFNDNLEIQIGVEGRYTNRYFIPAYMPALFSFYNTDERYADWYPIDFFVQFKIDRFRAFVQSENLNSLWQENVYYLTQNHPLSDNTIRFGIAWTFLN